MRLFGLFLIYVAPYLACFWAGYRRGRCVEFDLGVTATSELFDRLTAPVLPGWACPNGHAWSRAHESRICGVCGLMMALQDEAHAERL